MKAILTDVTLCVGCEKCVAACKDENDLGPDVPFRWLVD
ncbi:MAG: 4Fe-4S dicluster domain-containing protein, partial [Deltaproteobacteria bacterium]|nr:4Fe-4S dicluster domain-containing protein [Deltaproteobacteria bacterium]